MDKQALTVISSLLSLLGICYLFFWRYRAFEVAWFRQDLFDLRDELFDLALSGKISFDHRAYGVLRSTINGYIRYGDRLTLWHALFLGVFLMREKKEAVQSFHQMWANAQKGLDPKTIEELAGLRKRMGNMAVRHIILSAPEASLLR